MVAQLTSGCDVCTPFIRYLKERFAKTKLWIILRALPAGSLRVVGIFIFKAMFAVVSWGSVRLVQNRTTRVSLSNKRTEPTRTKYARHCPSRTESIEQVRYGLDVCNVVLFLLESVLTVIQRNRRFAPKERSARPKADGNS